MYLTLDILPHSYSRFLNTGGFSSHSEHLHYGVPQHLRLLNIVLSKNHKDPCKLLLLGARRERDLNTETYHHYGRLVQSCLSLLFFSALRNFRIVISNIYLQAYSSAFFLTHLHKSNLKWCAYYIKT